VNAISPNANSGKKDDNDAESETKTETEAIKGVVNRAPSDRVTKVTDLKKMEAAESEDCSNWWIPACYGHCHNWRCRKWNPPKGDGTKIGTYDPVIEAENEKFLWDKHEEKESGILTSQLNPVNAISPNANSGKKDDNDAEHGTDLENEAESETETETEAIKGMVNINSSNKIDFNWAAEIKKKRNLDPPITDHEYKGWEIRKLPPNPEKMEMIDGMANLEIRLIGDGNSEGTNRVLSKEGFKQIRMRMRQLIDDENWDDVEDGYIRASGVALSIHHAINLDHVLEAMERLVNRASSDRVTNLKKIEAAVGIVNTISPNASSKMQVPPLLKSKLIWK